MNDFDIAGATPAEAAGPILTHLTIAYALSFYFAGAVLVFGLALQTARLLARNTGPLTMAARIDDGLAGFARRAFRAGTDVLLLRSTFFADRWAWIFGAAFHFGLFLVLARHLRYFLDPSWVGPLWKLVVLVQPFGFYGGLALPLGAGAWWLRQIVLSRGRILSGWPDHAVMGLLIAIPLVGYANTLVHTDVVAVKAFMVGLITFHWQPLPEDPLLLIHLWLVAVLMVLLPFSRVLLLLPLGRLLQLSNLGAPPGTRRARLLHVIAPTLAVVLLIPVAVAARQMVTHGFQRQGVDFTGLVAEHRTDDPTVMIRNHPRFLFTFRSDVLHHGAKSPNDNLERCVTCHVVKDKAGQPVDFHNPTHFCVACHNKAAVTIDCFECHNSKPTPHGQAGLDPPRLAAIATSPRLEAIAAPHSIWSVMP